MAPQISLGASTVTTLDTSFTPTAVQQVKGSPSLPTVFHVETRLPNGKPALLLDMVSVGNLAGDDWVRQQAAPALRAGLRPEQRRRERPLTARGVGQRWREVRS